MASLYILDLLAHLLDQQLEVHRHLGYGDIDRFRAQRVGFAVQFLHQEIEALADGAALVEDAPELADMRR